MTKFIASSANVAVKPPFEKAELLHFSHKDQSAIAQALMNPFEANAALKRAFAKQSQLIATHRQC